jgi:hypothetical protein
MYCKYVTVLFVLILCFLCRFVNGSTKHNEYRFFHWAGIDTFIYFSHQLVTIPPPVWINSAHLHGTKILGMCVLNLSFGFNCLIISVFSPLTL